MGLSLIHICAMAAVLHGKVDQIILTGGIAYNPFTAQTLTDYCLLYTSRCV